MKLSTAFPSTLPHKTKIGYGIAQLGVSGVEFAIRIHLLLFYTDVAGLRADLAGYAVAIGVIWDAITDPFMGSLSDHTKTSWGKRRPYILFGGIALAAAYILLFSPPNFQSQEGKFVFLLISYILLNTAMTVIAVPLYALGGELTEDSHERNEVYGWLMFFFGMGTILGVVLPSLALGNLDMEKASLAEKAQAYSLASVYLAIVLVLSSTLTFLSTKNRDLPYTNKPTISPKEFFLSLGSVLKNKIFFPFFLSYFVGMVGIGLNGVTALYYYHYRLGLSRWQSDWIIGAFMGLIMVSLPFWIWMANHFGKKKPAFWGGFLLGCLITLAYLFLPPHHFWPPMTIAMIAGVLGGASVLFYSLVPDIVDYDEAITGEHREGLYFGVLNMGIKMSRALSIALAGNLLSWIGFVPNAEQTPEVSTRLAWIFGPGVGSFIMAGALLLLFMPLTEEKHQRVQKILHWKKKKKREKGIGPEGS